MKNFISFIKTTALGGLVLILPVAVIILALTYIGGLLISFNEWIAKHLPYEFFGHPAIVLTGAILTVILVCFVGGLIVKTRVGNTMAQSMDSFLNGKLPMYGLLKQMTRRFSGDEVLTLRPAEVDIFGSGSRMLSFVMEELPDGRYAVFVPSSPVVTVGQVYLLQPDEVVFLQDSPKLAIDAISQWGSGASQLYNTENKPATG